MMKTYYAKSKLSNGSQPTVKEHLSAVSELAEQYGNEFERGEEARVAGLFHDFGKYSDTFQDVLRGLKTNVDHAMCGASFLTHVSKKKKAYEPIIEVINGHHNGLVAFDELKPVLHRNFCERERFLLNNQKTAAVAGTDEYKKSYECFKN